MDKGQPLEKFHSNIAEDIQQYQRSIVCVGREDDTPAFAYTVGNQLRGLPELLVVGTSDGGFLNLLSDKMIERGRAFDDGEVMSLGGKHPVKIIRADYRAKDEYTVQAGVHFGTEAYEVQQVLICDRDGRFPGESGCLPPYRDMPILRRN